MDGSVLLLILCNCILGYDPGFSFSQKHVSLHHINKGIPEHEYMVLKVFFSLHCKALNGLFLKLGSGKSGA